VRSDASGDEMGKTCGVSRASHGQAGGATCAGSVGDSMEGQTVTNLAWVCIEVEEAITEAHDKPAELHRAPT
jgi:hypothetical protein